MAGRKTLYSTVSFRLRPADLAALKAYAGSRGKSTSEILRGMLHWMLLPPPSEETGIAAVSRAMMSGPIPGGMGAYPVAPAKLFRLGEDRRIKHLDEGSVLEGMDVEGQG